METLIDRLPVPLFCYDLASGRLSYVNEKFAEALGYSVAEVLDIANIHDIVAEDDREDVRAITRRRHDGDDDTIRYVTKIRHRDGRLLDAEIHSAVADTGGGRVVIGVASDVTSKLAGDRELREREEYFRVLTDHISDVIAIVDADYALTYVSASAERVLGCDGKAWIGMAPWTTVHPDDAPRLREALAELARGGQFECAEVRFRHKNGQWRTVEVDAANLLDHPLIRGLVLNLHDVTERKRMERELGQLHRLTSLGRMAAQMAHEFNNVMMGIKPMVEAIRRRAADDLTLLGYAAVIEASLQRGKRVTADILRFGRPAQLVRRATEVRTLFDQAAAEIRPLLGERVKLQVSVSDPPLHVCADAAQLTQALINLALNARDAVDAGGGTVTLAAQPGKGDLVHISVTDTGCGIAEADLPFIFEPLFTTKHRGTGLGLSVVFQIVAAHGGRVTVDSEPGKGTTFHLFVPAAAAECATDAAGPPAKPRHRLQSLRARVLIVEDEEPVAHGLRLLLKTAGIDVEVVETGRDVLPAMADFNPDVVVLDLSLPDDDGRAVYQRIASQYDVPVVFSSGHASDAEIAQLLALPRTAFLMKPYASDDLLDVIERLLVVEGRHV